MRNECCGGYISMESPELAAKKSNAVVENAKAAGAEMIITACPLCYPVDGGTPDSSVLRCLPEFAQIHVH